MKSNIKCDADNCMHNKDGLCDAAVVHVRDGKAGTESARCTTYAYRVSNAGSRLLMEMGEDMSLDRDNQSEDIPIACGKTDCTHNEDCSCQSKEIHVMSPCKHGARQCACGTYKQR